MNDGRILGIDPGSRITGYGVIEARADGPRYVASGAIVTDSDVFHDRLAQIYTGVAGIVAEHRPQWLAIEDVFVAYNVRSALKLGQARGVAIAAAIGAGIGVSEYSPRSVKQIVVGSGKATKAQVQYMVRALLGLDAPPQADAADALAVAICHVNTRHDRS